MPGQPRDKVSPIFRLIQPSRTGGQSERLRSGTVAHGYFRDQRPHGFAVPDVALVPGASGLRL